MQKKLSKDMQDESDEHNKKSGIEVKKCTSKCSKPDQEDEEELFDYGPKEEL